MATATTGEIASDMSLIGESHGPMKIKGLPSGWKREVVIRKNGQSAGKTDVYYYSPCGKKFRSKPQIARFLGECADLTAFDFSRAGDGTQRRRARDRTAKKVDLLKPMSMARPLSNNPLRASGPVRRTCGVIKLPVTYVRMPSPSEEECSKERANSPDDSASDHENPKTSPLNLESITTATPVSVAVPSLWENRLLGVKACDYETGDDIIPPPKMMNGTSNEIKLKTGNVNRVSTLKTPPPLSSSSNVNTLLSQHLQQSLKQAVSLSSPSGTVIPSLLSHTGRVSPSLKNGQSKDSHGVLVSLGNKNTASSSVGSGAIVRVEGKQVVENLSRMVTETDLRLQEEKVRHLRQQLFAAERS